jgi:hypothetical protein
MTMPNMYSANSTATSTNHRRTPREAQRRSAGASPQVIRPMEPDKHQRQGSKILWGVRGTGCALCRQILVAKQTPIDHDAVVGEEAHIAARSAGGPRHGECAPDLVDSCANLILLCRVDRKKVDDQSQYYTAYLLQQVKADHEPGSTIRST